MQVVNEIPILKYFNIKSKPKYKNFKIKYDLRTKENGNYD